MNSSLRLMPEQTRLPVAVPPSSKVRGTKMTACEHRRALDNETMTACVGCIQASWRTVDTDEWYFVEMSWSVDSGLEIYVNLRKVADSQSTETPPDHVTTDSRMCVACLNAPKNDTLSGLKTVAANVAVDELSICYGSLSKLTEFEFLQRGTLAFAHF